MAASVHRIHPNRDEGQDGNPKAVKLADTRGEILSQITGSAGQVVWAKAHAMGQSFVPTMAAQTIIKFATGQTATPSTWTIRMMVKQAEGEIWVLPRGVTPPKGAYRLE